MKSTAQPLLSPAVSIRDDDGDVIIDAPDLTLTFHDDSAHVLQRTMTELHGGATVESISSRCEVSARHLAAIMSTLEEDRLVVDTAAVCAARNQDDFVRAYFEECRFWSKTLFHQPFWQTIRRGTAPRTLVLGWGIEMFHYVRAANEHMAAAVAYCPRTSPWRYMLAEHYIEEHNHDDIFIKGLVECGLDEDVVFAAPPLASTRALINFLTELATSDTVAYTGAFGIMQSAQDRTTPRAIHELYDEFSRLYPYAAGMFDAFRSHALIDVELDHQGLVLEDIASSIELSKATRTRIVQAARDTAEHFMLFFEGVLDFYSAESTSLPRRAVDVRSLL